MRAGRTRARAWVVAVALEMAVLPTKAEPPLDSSVAQSESAQRAAFVVEEATIGGIHAALAAGHTTCLQIVETHLRRIEAFDKRGPVLNAMIAINRAALDAAAEWDRARIASRVPLRSLDCIPVILKDNFDTADMPTTGGSVTLASSVPLRDAFVVKKLREAGAIILGKANLTELALGGTTVSSLGGQTRNPYDLTRTPGGSSGGTGAAIAASFGVVGTGTDTGQSVRSPASAQSLTGLRPTRGLISRSGIIPISPTQDEAGPIARTVEDTARLLDVMAGYDPDDPITAFGAHRIPSTYTASLDAGVLNGARIGVLTQVFGREPVHEQVNRVVEAAIEQMKRAGAVVIEITIPRLERLTDGVQVADYEAKAAFDSYVARLGPLAAVKSFDELVARGEFHPYVRASLEAERRAHGNEAEYQKRLLRRHDLRQAVMIAFAANGLDAILYPHQQRLVVPIGEEQVERNGVLSNSTGFPAIAFPGGFSTPTDSAPLGVPVGIELLGPEWSEPTLLRLAFAFEQAAKVRRPPASTPRLDASKVTPAR
ncbi:MAG TPA: amidase family protein [Vicinamibacterales bacterium]|nr:amidase family protein [Vicinamibacterales bacterium]